MLEMKMRIQDKELENVQGTCGNSNTNPDIICCSNCNYSFNIADAKSDLEGVSYGNIRRYYYIYKCPKCGTWIRY